MAKKDVVMVRAIVDRASPDRVQWKPYLTDLTFGGKLSIEIPVPADQVISQKGDEIVLTIEGYASLLKAYTIQIERMNEQTNIERFNPQRKY